MMIFSIVAHFIVSEWLWGITWDTYYISFNIVVSILLLKFFLKINMVHAVFMSLLSQLAAWVAFTALAFMSMYLIGIGGNPERFICVPSPLYATVFLGLIYAILQMLFYICTKRYYKNPIATILMITFISNNLTVLIALLLGSAGPMG